MFGGAHHGRKDDVQVVLFDRHVIGHAAVLKKMNMFHLLGDAGNIMNVLEHALPHLITFQLQYIDSGAACSSMDAVFAQI